MPQRNAKGNTLVEYGILFGLISVASVGAITLFGGSTSQLLGGQGTEFDSATTNVLVRANNGTTLANATPGGSNPGRKPGATGSWTDGFMNLIGAPGSENQALSGNSVATQTQADINSVTATKGIPLSGGGNGGTNATSMDGNTIASGSQSAYQAVQQTLKLAEQLNQMADTVDDEALKAWYKEAARYTLLLAGSEATFSYKADGVENLALLADTDLASQDALWSIQQNRLLLGNKLYDFPSALYPGQQAQAISMVNSVLDTMWNQYGGTLDRYTTGQSTLKGREKEQIDYLRVFLEMGVITQEYNRPPEEVLALSQQAMADGNLNTSSEGVYSGAVNGAVMDQRSH